MARIRKRTFKGSALYRGASAEPKIVLFNRGDFTWMSVYVDGRYVGGFDSIATLRRLKDSLEEYLPPKRL
jgi:hypothetical protein